MRNKSQKRFWVSTLAILLALLMIVPILLSAVNMALAITTPEIEKLREQAKELAEQKEALQEEIQQMEGDKAATIERKVALDQQISLTQQEIDNVTALIQEITLQINVQQEALDEAMAQEEEETELYSKRVRVLEESGTVSYLGVLLQADSFADFLDRLTMISEILDYDQSVMEDLENTREEIQEQKAAIEDSKQEQAQYKDELAEKQEELEGQYEEATQLIESINNEISAAEQAVAEQEAAEADLQNEIAELVAQAEKEEEERLRREAWEKQQQSLANGGNSGDSPYTSTSFIWPLPGYYNITSPFGMRFHPTLHVYKLHTGTDIGAPRGTRILAAAPGTVITAGYNRAYGNYVVIHHGNGTQTLYAHMSQIYTSKGATVSAGDLIGGVGMTGYATGNHLHFEVIINGTQVNAMQYFS